jgi:Predicted esterase of the alpha-beta hydrolase superfamily
MNPPFERWRHVFLRVALVLASCFITGCAHEELVRKNYINVQDDYSQLSGWENLSSRASASSTMLGAIDLSEADRDYRPFLGVAISGGGSRAANFGMYVLKELDRLGVLDRVDAISSVSGGSIAVAHFGLYYPRLGDAYWAKAESDLRQDLRDDWLLRHAHPGSWRTLYRSDINASTMLAETYDAKLFHGATFASLGPPGPGRPHILINATAIRNPEGFFDECAAQGGNAYGNGLSTFVFTVEAFRDCLGSRLPPYSIASAVAASSAYPGLFSPITLQTNTRLIDGDRRPKEYLHMIDGGVSDNLGVDALVMAANRRRLEGLALDDTDHTHLTINDSTPCFLIVVDAFVDGGEKLEEEYPDLRHGLMDRVIDPSWRYVFDGLLQRRRVDSLVALGIDPNKVGEDGDYARAVGRHTITLREAQGMTQIHIGNIVIVTPNHAGLACGVWHISLRDVFELGADKGNVLQNKQTIFKRGSIYAMVTNISTDLKLTGAKACTSREYQSALSDAAKILVREDADSLKILRNWLTTHGATPARDWTPDAYGSDGKTYPVTAIAMGPLGTPSGRVRCTK